MKGVYRSDYLAYLESESWKCSGAPLNEYHVRENGVDWEIVRGSFVVGSRPTKEEAISFMDSLDRTGAHYWVGNSMSLTCKYCHTLKKVETPDASKIVIFTRRKDGKTY